MTPVCPHCAYENIPGHNHDDNRVSGAFVCANGHTVEFVKRNRCPACSWVGSDKEGHAMVDEWPAANHQPAYSR